jgi:hypothetical protein
VSRVVVVASLRDGAAERAREIVAGGPPYELASTGLTAHGVYVTDREVVFLFEGESARQDVQRLIGLPELWQTAAAWRDVLAGRPRVASEAFAWARDTPG